MLQTLRRAFKIGDLRRRILFTMGIFLIFRIGAHIPVPGVDKTQIAQLFEQGSLFGLLDMFSGGALKQVSLFALGIMPYINASIIMNLLTMVVPKFEQWAKEGDEGRKKLTQATRYGTVVIAAIQALGMAYYMQNVGAINNPGALSIITITITLTAGTIMLMWLGEQITEKGIGNGISLIIFANIVARLPEEAGRIFSYLEVGRINFFNVILLLLVGIAAVVLIIKVQEGQRRIPVQYSKRVVGRKVYGGQSTHIPLKVNQAGVIPVIFAASILAFPPTMAQFIDKPWTRSVAAALDGTTIWYISLYTLFIIFFSYFYTAITFNPQDVSDNLKKYGGFIPGIRPGRTTTEYLNKVVVRLTLAGAIFLAFIAVMPTWVQRVTDIPGIYFGGTALIIVVGVALETMKQIEAQLLMRHYQGFIKK